MRYIAIEDPGPQSRLLIKEQALPDYENNQLLIRVKAAGINRADLMQRQGKYPPPAGESSILGLEIAGEVVALGTRVKNFKLHDKVYGLVASGGYAQYCCLHPSLAAPIPERLSFEEAAAIPEALLTAHATLFVMGQLKQAQTLLIHAAGSGVASLAIQMAKHIKARVVTTVSTQKKMDKALLLNADTVINYKKENLKALLTKDSIHLIVDFIGGDYFPIHLELLKPQGKLVQVACMQGYKV